MEIRCRNCHSSFTVEVGLTEAPEAANCPNCDFANLLGAASDRNSGMLSARCASCGKEMAATPDQAVPICQACSGLGGDAPEAVDDDQWMVRKAGAKTYGPFDTATIRQWVGARKLEAGDELARSGGQWQPLFDIERFASAFSDAEVKAAQKGYNAQKKAEAAQAKRSAHPRRVIPWGRVARAAGASLFMVASLAGAWFTSTHLLLVVPEHYAMQAQAFVEEQLLERVSAKAAQPSRVEVEAKKVIAALAKEHPDVTGSATALRLRGLTESFKDNPAAQEQARRFLEKAVVANPDDPMALAALAEVYSHLIREVGTNYGKTALRLIDRAQELAPTNPDVLRARAAFLLAAGKTADGQSAARKAFEKNPGDAAAAYLDGVGYMLTKPPANTKAIEALKKAVATNDRHQAAHRLVAEAYWKEQHYGDAADHFKAKLALSPSHVQTLYELGALYEEAGSGSHAMEYYRKADQASQADGGHLMSLVKAGVILLQTTSDTHSARQVLHRATQHKAFESLPLEARKDVHTQLASAHLIVGDLRKAQSEVDAALKLDPQDGPALYQSGLIAARRGDRASASRLLKQASGVETDSEDQSRIRFALGMISHVDAKFGEAITELKAATDADRYNIQAQLALAGVYLAASQPNEALSVMYLVSKLDPLYERRRRFTAERYYQKSFDVSWVVPGLRDVARTRHYQADPKTLTGIAMYHAGMSKKAGEMFSRALKQDANNAAAAFYLGLMNLEANLPARAIAPLVRATQSDPQAGVYHAYLGEAYVRTGRFQEAGEAYQRANQYLLNSPTASLGIGFLKVKQGLNEEARASFLSALEADPDFVAARWQLYQFHL